eukprot:jgi/Picsp_1/573/NSC_00570-R1_---NA---
MEARVAGTVRQELLGKACDVLTALSGSTGCPIEVHEIVLQKDQSQDVHLYMMHVAKTKVYEEGTRWIAYHYSKPPWGDARLSRLEATIRMRKEASSSTKTEQGANALDEFRRQRYSVVKYHIVKQGQTWDVRTPHGITMHVLVYTLWKGKEENGSVVADQCVEESLHVVEVWADVEQETIGYEKTIVELKWLNSMLESCDIRLEPLVDRRAALVKQNK